MIKSKKNMKKDSQNMINTALQIADAYIQSICSKEECTQMREELFRIAKKKVGQYDEQRQEAINYQETQQLLSKLNEKESIRKSKGVYYTPNDVVRFIVANSIKSLYGKLNRDNIGDESLADIPYKSFATKKTVFDPTCGAGEYLISALDIKFDLLDQHYTRMPASVVADTVATVFGNDINVDSTTISKMRLLICVLNRYGANKCIGLSKILNQNFYSYDYVLETSEKKKYDVIVGNPPYVEDFKSGLKLKRKYGNIYANVLINASKQLSENGSLGFIIPLSYISTPRMNELRNELFEIVREQYILSYADRPDCLFDSVHQKLCILVGKRKKTSRKVYTGSYQYWYKSERSTLFEKTQVVENDYFSDSCIPKLGTRTDIDIFRKIIESQNNVSVYDVSRTGEEVVYLNRRETFWMKAYREKVDDPDYKVFSFNSKGEADYCYCLINSSLFWWYWISTSDCWHVSKTLNGFMAPFPADYRRAGRLAKALRNRLEETKVYVGTKQTEYEYKHRDCIKEIRNIDTYINGLFGLTDEESEYIKSYAFKYRTSGGAE